MFPDRANISFAEVRDRTNILLRVWERGAGATLACGSAACATLVAAVRRGLTERRATLALPGGELGIEWRADDHVLMTGPGRTRGTRHAYARGFCVSREAVEVLTFGCRLNIVESDAMRAEALAAGHDDLVIVNTCAVTAEATRQARQAIRRARRARPKSRIVVTGCAAEIDGPGFAAMPEVDALVGNARKTAPESWARPGLPRKSRRTADVPPATPAASWKSRTAAIIAAPSASSRSGAAPPARCRPTRWWRPCGAWSKPAPGRPC